MYLTVSLKIKIDAPATCGSDERVRQQLRSMNKENFNERTDNRPYQL
jgi:hypothetical protein